MGMVSAKLRRAGRGYSHWCPGCEEMHLIAVFDPFRNGAVWTFDGNVDRPTFRPSVNISLHWSDADPDMVDERCHYFITNGQIQFCPDSTHKLSGQTVELPDLPPHVRDNP